MKLKTADILNYSRKPPTLAFQAILDALSSSRPETWNLIFLLLPVERRYVFTTSPNIKHVPVACWRTVNCDLITGEFVNPFDAEPGRRRTVAHLLQGPAQDFVDWASNCAIADKLPVHAFMPDWLATAQSRLHLCAGYRPEKALDGMEDAIALLSQFKA